MIASKENYRDANFAHGFLLHEGKNIERNIDEAIHYYKEASSFNNQYAKNNLGIMYKHGYGNIKGRAGNAIVYFEEAIRQKNDYLSMYNLAHIYIYDKTIKGDINKAIELLIRSSKTFIHSKILLCLLLIKNFGMNIASIQKAIEKQTEENSSLMNEIIETMSYFGMNKKEIEQTGEKSDLSKEAFIMMDKYKLSEKHSYEHFYESYRNKDFVYNIKFEPILVSDLEKANIPPPPKYPNAKDISSEFYNGFGQELL